jgi:hypothetical protein
LQTADAIRGFILPFWSRLRTITVYDTTFAGRYPQDNDDMTQPNILNAADYADALLAARRAKTTLFLGILVLLLIELSLFFVARSTGVLHNAADAKGSDWRAVLQYLICLIDFLGLILPALYAVVLYLILKILLVGRLLGAGRLTSAFLWSIVLVLLLFPWQSFLNNPVLNNDPTGIRIPGVLYTWAEVTHERLGAQFDAKADIHLAVLRWTRFVVMPVGAVILLLYVQMKSDRGLRQALGNSAAELPETTSSVER